MLHKLILLLLLIFFAAKSKAISYVEIDSVTTCVILSDSLSVSEFKAELQARPSPLLKAFRDKQSKNKKIIAVALAFPLPFGIVGLHRIYLGSAPYVPVAYIASLGGMFGVLPFIDFCVLLAVKKIDPYTNNQKIFMWVN